ncbi:MAG TPA: hypothetical protein VLU25_15290 [Acidobacteriota bacterium]|nr:hypothetical protein [Acidobacteriota bacterium]
MAKLKTTICKWDRGDFEKLYSEHPSVVAKPRFACRKCGRVARKKKWLCKAFKLHFKPPKGS